MKQGKLMLLTILFAVVIAGILSFKIRQNSILYYLTTAMGETVCISAPLRTTTGPNETLGTIIPPAGGIGWYTTNLCDIPETFKEKLYTTK